MLKAEAQWVANALDGLDLSSFSPLLNVGSSDAAFRQQVQPWINDEIIIPIQKRGGKIYHLDFCEGDGIDLHGDLTDESFVSSLRSYGFRSLMFCNVLEHVTERASICHRLEALVPIGGYLIVTVPNRFPYHPDPIDTMFRPEVQEIARLFPNCAMLRGEVIDCGTGWDYLDKDVTVLFRKVFQRLSRSRETGGVKGSASFFPWLFRQFRQSCVLLRKERCL